MKAEKSGVDGLRDAIRKMAARPEGVASEDIPEWTKVRVGQQCGKLVGAGELFRGRRHQKDVRFFRTMQAADAYVASYTKPAPVSIPHYVSPRWDKDTLVIKAADFKFTHCPSPKEFGAAARLARVVTPDAGCKP